MGRQPNASDGWEEKSLDQLATLVGGGTPTRSNLGYFGTEIDWVTPSDLRPIGDVELLGPVAEGLTKSGLASCSAKEIAPGSVLFSSRATIGKVAVTDRVCATNQGFVNFVPKKGVVDPWFLAYLLTHHTPAITRLAGKTTYQEIGRSRLRTFKVSVPCLEEQQRIVARIKTCMERVREIQILQRESLAEARSLLGGFLGDLERGSRWPGVPLGELVQTRNGRSVRSTGEGGNGYVLTLSAVRGVSVDLSMRKHVELADKTAHTFRVKRDDVFVSRSNTRDLVGLSAVVSSEPRDVTIFPDLLIRLCPIDERLLPRFLAYALRFPSIRNQIKARARGTSQSMVKISAALLKDVLVPVPHKCEQEAAVAIMDEVHTVSRLLASSLDSSEPDLLGQAVLRKAFAGEL